MLPSSGYRWELLPQLAEAVAAGDEEIATRLIPVLLDEMDIRRDTAFLKLRCAQAMSACLRAALRTGASSQRLYHEHIAELDRLAALRARHAIRRRFAAYVIGLTSLAQPVARDRLERLVADMRADMAASIARPRSLGDYARALDLSAGHLSRSFTRIVGRSFRDEQLRLRDEAAKNLLRDTDLPQTTIAERVGLRSCSQFIADFRRRQGCTPAAWRRRRS